MEYTVIQVTRGDTAAKLARKYKTTERSLFALNGTPSFTEGERLIVATDNRRYTVKPLDTIESIAVKFSTTVQNLSAANGGLTEIFLGETLFLP